MLGLRLGFFFMPGPAGRRAREGYVRPELRDLATLADLLDDPAFKPESIERATYRLMGLEAPQELELPTTMRQDIRRAQRFRREAT